MLSAPRTRSTLTTALLVGLLSTLILAGSAHAADKPFSVVLSNADGSTPATLAAGTTGTVRATYTNINTQQQLGSSNLVVPAGLQVVSASPSSKATVSGNTVQLRNLNLAGGASTTITMQVAAGCSAANYVWPAPLTKQANNFNGPPGNDLNLDAASSDLRTVVSGSCTLHFVNQPANARIAQAITSVAYDPSGAPITVEVLNGTGQRVTGSTPAVTMAIGTNAGGGTLSGTKTVNVNATTGLASFSTLSIDRAGANYTLVASSPGIASATSGTFNIDQYSVFCAEDVDCNVLIPLSGSNQSFGGSSSVKVTALQGQITDTDSGFLTSSLGVGGPLDCAGYKEFTPDIVAIAYSALDREKSVIATIDKKVMNAESNNGTPTLQSCFGAPFTFATIPGTRSRSTRPSAWAWLGIQGPAA